jgi:hypothetical protein
MQVRLCASWTVDSLRVRALRPSGRPPSPCNDRRLNAIISTLNAIFSTLNALDAIFSTLNALDAIISTYFHGALRSARPSVLRSKHATPRSPACPVPSQRLGLASRTVLRCDDRPLPPARIRACAAQACMRVDAIGMVQLTTLDGNAYEEDEIAKAKEPEDAAQIEPATPPPEPAEVPAEGGE